MNNDLYIKVNLKEKTILEPPKELELNWNNISGLCYLSDNELKDLSWAGYDDIGFIKFTKDNLILVEDYYISAEIISQIKRELKDILSEMRYTYETGGVIIDNRYHLSTSDRSKILIYGKYLECLSNPELSFNWKSTSGPIHLTANEFIGIFNGIQKFTQECFDIEIKFIEKINSCSTILELFSIDLTSIEWTSNHIEL